MDEISSLKLSDVLLDDDPRVKTKFTAASEAGNGWVSLFGLPHYFVIFFIEFFFPYSISFENEIKSLFLSKSSSS